MRRAVDDEWVGLSAQGVKEIQLFKGGSPIYWRM